jgi:hypothetical protein
MLSLPNRTHCSSIKTKGRLALEIFVNPRFRNPQRTHPEFWLFTPIEVCWGDLRLELGTYNSRSWHNFTRDMLMIAKNAARKEM